MEPETLTPELPPNNQQESLTSDLDPGLEEELLAAPDHEEAPLQTETTDSEIAAPEATPTPEAPPALPSPVSLSATRREFYIVNRTIDPRRRARELVETRLREEQKRGSWKDPRTWVRRVKFRYLEEYYRQAWTEKATRAMIEHGNSYLEYDFVRGAVVDAEAHRTEEQESAEAKIHEQKIRQAEGVPGGDIREATGALKEAIISEIITPVINRTVTTEAEIQGALAALVEAHQSDPDVQAVFGRDATKYGRLAEYFASDLLEVGTRVREDLDAHEYGLSELDERISIKLANACWAAQTDAKFGIVDKIVAKTERYAPFLTPGTIGAASSIGITLAWKLPRNALRAPLIGSALGGLYSAIKRTKELKYQRAVHQIERAYGGEVPTGANRRREMESYAYKMASMGELVEGTGYDEVVGKERLGVDELVRKLSENPSDMELRGRTLSRIAEIRSRLDTSATNEIDLIQFEGRVQVEQGRLELIKVVVQLKKALRNADMSEEEIVDEEGRLRLAWDSRFAEEQQAKDRAFRLYQLRKGSTAFALGAVTGLVAGLGAQELGAVAKRMIFDQPVAETWLESHTGIGGILGKISDKAAPSEFGLPTGHGNLGVEEYKGIIKNVMASGRESHIYMGDYGFRIDPTDHSVEIVDAQGKLIEGLYEVSVTEDGSFHVTGELPAEAKDAIGQIGFKLTEDESVTKLIREEVLEKAGTHLDSSPGFPMNIPDGTRWVPDELNQTGDPLSWKLIVEGDPGKSLLEHVTVDQTGDMHYTVTAGMRTLIDVEEGSVEFVQGVEAEKFWDEIGMPVDHREWYSYDAPGSQANELTAYTIKQGDTLILDMSRMGLGYQQGLNPNPIDVQEVIRDGQAGFAMSLPGHTDRVIFIPEGIDGVRDGLLHLDPNDHINRISLPNGESLSIADIYALTINKTELMKYDDGDIGTEYFGRREVFNLGVDGNGGFVEACRYIERDDGGGHVLQAFATLKGEADAGGLETTPGTIDLTRDITEIVEEEVPTYSMEPPDVAPPIIPIPLWRQHPLEELQDSATRRRRREGFYGYGYGYGRSYVEEDWDRSMREYEARRSPRLTANKDAELVEREEVASYIHSFSPEYRRELGMLDAAIGRIMSEECRLVITLPCRFEDRNVSHTLECFLNQRDRNGNPLSPDLFELIIVENIKSGESRDNTQAEVLAFKRLHPEMHVSLVFKEFTEDEPAGVGYARKYAADLGLYRGHQRTSTRGDLILVSNDMDTYGINPTYATDIIQEFDSKPELEAVTGKWQLPEEALAKPNIRAAHRLMYFLDRVITKDAADPHPRSPKFPGLRGANAAFRTDIYAAIGGYNPKSILAEDLEIGWMINAARRWNPHRQGYLNRAEVTSDPRRILVAFLQKVPLIDMYHGFSENDEVRRADNHALLDQIPDAFDEQAFIREVEAFWQAGIDGAYKWIGMERYKELFARAMDMTGVKYEITPENRIVVTDLTRLKEGLRRHETPPATT